MKKVLLLLCVALMLVACGKSEEERVKELVAEASRNTMLLPESYDPVSLHCDSMSIDIINDKNIRKAVRITELRGKADNLQREIESDMEQRDFWKGKDHGFYTEYSKKVDDKVAKRMKYESEMLALFNELQKEYWSKKDRSEFCGYIVEHRFRAKNNAGIVGFCDMIFLLNKDKTEVVGAYNVADPSFQKFMGVIDSIVELGPESEGESEAK